MVEHQHWWCGSVNTNTETNQMANRLKSDIKFKLMKSIEELQHSQRKLQITSNEFRIEMQQHLGCKLTQSNIEGAVIALNLRMTDLFKAASNTGRSIYADIYRLEQRVLVLEEKLEGL
jgi:hypothetical protein